MPLAGQRTISPARWELVQQQRDMRKHMYAFIRACMSVCVCVCVCVMYLSSG